MPLLDGKTCIVTGGAGSIGLAAARAFLREGARVVLVDHHHSRLDEATASIGAGARVMAIAAQVADAAETQRYIAQGVAAFGPLDVLFLNAGIAGEIRPVTEYPEEVFDAVMAVNVRAPFLACKYALPRMNDGGSIVITSSVVGVTADPGICAYATSKHAVIGLMRTVAKEAAPRRIRVNVVAPGPIDNGFQRNVEAGLSTAIGRDATAFLDGIIPLGRHGTADEIAEAVLYLASPRSSFTTGTVLMADGGMHI